MSDELPIVGEVLSERGHDKLYSAGIHAGLWMADRMVVKAAEVNPYAGIAHRAWTEATIWIAREIEKVSGDD